MEFRFADPWLLALLVLPLLVWLRRERRAGSQFPGFALAQVVLRPSRGPALFRLLLSLGLVALVLAAARPQYGRTITERSQDGRDLMLLIDLSGSMRVDDMTDGSNRIDRLAAVFGAAKAFIAKRPDDRIGLVFFSTSALTSCPLTYDHATVTAFLERTEAQQRALWANGDEDGLLGGATNIGLGLGTALRFLTTKNALGRALVLVTDGADSRQLRTWVDPIDAAHRAAGLGITVYGIGVGNPDGTATARDPWGRVQTVRVQRELLPDMNRLEAIAKAGNGQAFAATDPAGLGQVFERIDQLQPTPRTETSRDDFADRAWWPLAAGFALLLLAFALEPRLRGVA